MAARGERKASFVALHMSAPGTKRRIAATQQLARFRSEADIDERLQKVDL